MELPLVVNAVLFSLLLIWYVNRFSIRTIGFLLISVYSLSAITAMFITDSNYMQLHLTLFPSFYFFLVFCIYAFPFLFAKRIKISIPDISINARALEAYVTVYIVAAAIETIALIPQVRGLDFTDLVSGYNNYFELVEEHKLYSNPFMGVVYNYVSYFRLPVMIVFFTYLTGFNSVSKLRKLIVLLAIVLPNLLYAISIVSRAKMFLFFVSFFCVYLVFYRGINKKVKKIVNITLLTGGSLIVFLFILISISRFNDTVRDSMLYYIGHSTIVFNDAVMTPCTGHTNGAIFFDWFYKLFGLPTISDADQICGTHAGNSFCTFLGVKYMDFGAIGAIIFGLLFAFFITRIMSKKKTDIASLFLYLFYLDYLIVGVFYDSCAAIVWFIVLIIYFIIKISLRNAKNNSVLSTPVSSSR